jgi:hypothetical protein
MVKSPNVVNKHQNTFIRETLFQVRQELRFRAHLELSGIPAHAFNKTTAVTVLSSAAWVEKLGASSASREDLGKMQVVA